MTQGQLVWVDVRGYVPGCQALSLPQVVGVCGLNKV